MNIVILTLHNPFDFDFKNWLSNKEHNIFLFLDKHSITCSETEFFNYKQSFKKVMCFDNYINNGLIDYEILKIHNEYKVDCIVSFGEDDILRASRLRKKFNIVGAEEEFEICFRDKVKMKELAFDNNIATPKFMALNSPLDLINFYQEINSPIFVKPRSASGSVFTKKISNEEDLKSCLSQNFIARIPFSEYYSDSMVEEYIDAEMYHIDGLIVDSELMVAWPSKYLSKNLDLTSIQNQLSVGSAMLDKNNLLTEPLLNFAKNVIKKFPFYKHSTFHIEVFVTEKNEIKLCEVAARTGGGKINLMFKTAFGCDLNKLLLNLHLATAKNDACEIKNIKSELLYLKEPKYIAGFFLISPICGSFLSGVQSCDFDFVADFCLTAKPGQKFNGREYSGDNMGHAVCVGSNEQILNNNIKQTVDWVYSNIKYE
jgi:hypothetical protein